MELLVFAIVTGIVTYGLERNRARQADRPRPRLSGSLDVVDRNTERVAAELISR
ncbi:MAG: hypothetical protein ACRDSK_23105 [Actinophytocola sp.]|uniref:hypothetical protein n=1 Tax=Actinophytocola sp. TaxID=1872138 RepID=UPI003D6B993A